MRAMIFAAGLGTRLKPFTNNKPKALVKVNDVPVIELIIKKMIGFGIDEIIINVHHFADQVIAFIKEKNFFNIRIEVSDERDKLLDTGGGLKKAAWFFDDKKPFLVHNVDVLTNIDLNKMYQYHIQNGGIATLAVQKRQTTRPLLVDDNNILCGWANKPKNIEKIIRHSHSDLQPKGFSCIHIIDNYFLELIKKEKDEVFSIMTPYLRLAGEKDIFTYDHTDDWWIDIGTKEKLEEADKYLKNY